MAVEAVEVVMFENVVEVAVLPVRVELAVVVLVVVVKDVDIVLAAIGMNMNKRKINTIIKTNKDRWYGRKANLKNILHQAIHCSRNKLDWRCTFHAHCTAERRDTSETKVGSKGASAVRSEVVSYSEGGYNGNIDIGTGRQ